jgi:hypothetical protein
MYSYCSYTEVFPFEKRSGMQAVTQNSVREGVLVIPMPEKKVPERRSGLRPSEKELPLFVQSQLHLHSVPTA